MRERKYTKWTPQSSQLFAYEYSYASHLEVEPKQSICLEEPEIGVLDCWRVWNLWDWIPKKKKKKGAVERSDIRSFNDPRLRAGLQQHKQGLILLGLSKIICYGVDYAKSYHDDAKIYWYSGLATEEKSHWAI